MKTRLLSNLKFGAAALLAVAASNTFAQVAVAQPL
ncbi:hypothetical protein PBAC_30220 [Pedobacter glucosidilyticus]|nr:hypothetical protein PBAC_30220 [Pedobacter glucosidilyticus]